METKIAAFEFGDLLYFAILIIGGIYSWYKKTQEAQQRSPKAPPAENQSSPIDSIDDFLKRFSSEPEIQKENPIEINEIEVAEIKKPEYIFVDEFTEIAKKELALNEIGNFVESKKEEASLEYFDGIENKNMKMRDLIIAETILNRPYQ